MAGASTKDGKGKTLPPVMWKCSCKHDDQDRIYGIGIRLHNSCKAGKSFRCTVCKNEKSG